MYFEPRAFWVISELLEIEFFKFPGGELSRTREFSPTNASAGSSGRIFREIDRGDALSVAEPENSLNYMRDAYASEKGVIWRNNVLFIAGTRDVVDVADDLLLPLHLVKRTHRYRDAHELLLAHPDTRAIVGHSLGGAVAVDLAREYHIPVWALNAPTFRPFGRVGEDEHLLRHHLDPVSAFGPWKQTTGWESNPHTWEGFNVDL